MTLPSKIADPRQPAHVAPRQVGILVLNRVGDDPRVRRQITAFQQAGWKVTAFGLSGSRSAPPPCNLQLVDPHAPAHAVGLLHGLNKRFDHVRRRMAVHLGARATEAEFWRLDPGLRPILQRAEQNSPDLWIANDWTTLPIVARLSARGGAPFVYDTHELATEEFSENRNWRVFMRPLVRTVEGRAIRLAGCVSCVSEAIADNLTALYPGLEPPCIVRNAPIYTAFTLRPTGQKIRVLYQGAVMPGRGLEVAIRSAALWRREFDLTIRGPGDAAYVASLEALAQSVGLADRVRLVLPVTVTDLLKAAAEFDIGLSILPGASRNNQAALPNKAFEYMMAGLALCVSDLPQLAGLVRRHEVGRVVEEETSAGIASAINGFDRDSLDMCKARALTAAKDLCWEREVQPLLQRCSELVEERRAVQPDRSAAAESQLRE